MTISEDGLIKNRANFAALSPLSFLERTRKTYPNQIAIEYKDYKINYEQASARCDALANFVKQKNINHGSTVAVMLPNIPVMWECHFGIPKVIGGNYNVLAVDVYKQVIGQQNFEMGAVVSMVLVFPALIAFAVDRIVQRKQVAILTSRSVVHEPLKSPHCDSGR